MDPIDVLTADACGNCRGCDHCARMTPVLMALATEPCRPEDLQAPDAVVTAALALFHRSADARSSAGSRSLPRAPLPEQVPPRIS